MTLLAINTASSKTSIAIISSGQVLAESSWQSQNDEAEKLMPAIQAFMVEQKLEYSSLDQVLVVKGPGSFTGLRIGVTVANTIAHLTNAELYEIDTFEYWHMAQEPGQSLPVLVYAGSGGVYLSETAGSQPEIIKIEELNEILAQRSIEEVCGDISEEQKQVLEVKFKEVPLSFGQIIQKIDIAKLKSVKIVQPLYIKDPAISKSKKYICST